MGFIHRRHMKFQQKMFAVYAVFGVLISVIAGGIYYYVSASNFKQREYQNLNSAARQAAEQYSDLLRSMEDVSRYLLSNPSVLSSIKILTQEARNLENPKVIMESKNSIRILMNSDYLLRKFYRIIYFNERGDKISTADFGDKATKEVPVLENFEWYAQVKDNKGKLIISGIHKDVWGKYTFPEVFSTIKKIQGDSMGFFEVQVAQAEMDKLFEPPDEQMMICLMDAEGRILYHTDAELDMEFYQQFLGRTEIPTGEIETETGTLLTSVRFDEVEGIYIIVSEDISVMKAELSNIYLLTILLAGGFLVLSLSYILIASKQLTRPVLQLHKMIQDTSLETLGEPIKIPDSSDEFRDLGKAYADMRERLNEAVIRETYISVLQLQAQFDLLQAQVNPHFIFNVLNIISARGIKVGDEIICDICDDLAWMLRYATNTKEKYATIAQEISHLDKYFALLKYRYEQKLNYTIRIKKEVRLQKVPRIFLQQLVENSVLHGFQNTIGGMNIMVEGWADRELWFIRVRDNGDGFSKEILEALYQKLQKAKQDLGEERSYIELEIGGMGLINLYARLYLLEGEHTIFKPGNWENGAEILVGGKMLSAEEMIGRMDEDVSDFCGGG